MIILFVGYVAIYLSVLPNLKMKCYPEVYNTTKACLEAYKCDCSHGKNCDCQYKNFKGEDSALGCDHEENPCKNAKNCNCIMGDKCTCQHQNKKQELVCPIEDIDSK